MGCQLQTIAGPTHGIDDVTNVANQQRLHCIAYTAAPAGAAAAAPSLCISTAASYGSSGGPGPIDLHATHMFLPMRPDSGKKQHIPYTAAPAGAASRLQAVQAVQEKHFLKDPPPALLTFAAQLCQVEH